MVKHIRTIILRKMAILLVITALVLMGVYLSSASNRAHFKHEFTWQSFQRILTGKYFLEAYEPLEVTSLVKLSRDDLLSVDPDVAYRDYYLAKIDQGIMLIKGTHNQFETLLNSDALAQYNLEGEQIEIGRLSDIVLEFNGNEIPIVKSAPFDSIVVQSLVEQGLKDFNPTTIIYTEEAGKIPRIVLLTILIIAVALLMMLYFLFFYCFPLQHRTMTNLKRRGINRHRLIEKLADHSDVQIDEKRRTSRLVVLDEYAIVFTLFNIKVILFDRLIQLFPASNGRFITYYEVGYSDFIRLHRHLTALLLEHLQQQQPYLLLEPSSQGETLTQTKIPDRQGIEKRVLLRKKAFERGLPIDYYLTEESGDNVQTAEPLSYEEQQAIQRAYDESIKL